MPRSTASSSIVIAPLRYCFLAFVLTAIPHVSPSLSSTALNSFTPLLLSARPAPACQRAVASHIFYNKDPPNRIRSYLGPYSINMPICECWAGGWPLSINSSDEHRPTISNMSSCSGFRFWKHLMLGEGGVQS